MGLNPFGVVLVAESMLKSPIAAMSADDKPLTFFMPINRGDCAGWVGVEFTLKAVRAEQADPRAAAVAESYGGVTQGG